MRYLLLLAILTACVACQRGQAEEEEAAAVVVDGQEEQVQDSAQDEFEALQSLSESADADAAAALADADAAGADADAALAASEVSGIGDFHGYPCTVDCSGHEAGYAWAEKKGIENPYDCGGNSQSFIEGCEAYAQERQEGIAAEESERQELEAEESFDDGY